MMPNDSRTSHIRLVSLIPLMRNLHGVLGSTPSIDIGNLGLEYELTQFLS